MDHETDLLCPITHLIMKAPVSTDDGHTYERAAIETWFDSGSMMSPLTGEQLSSRTLRPNVALKNVIHIYQKVWQPEGIAFKNLLIASSEQKKYIEQSKEQQKKQNVKCNVQTKVIDRLHSDNRYYSGKVNRLQKLQAQTSQELKRCKDALASSLLFFERKFHQQSIVIRQFKSHSSASNNQDVKRHKTMHEYTVGQLILPTSTSAPVLPHHNGGVN